MSSKDRNYLIRQTLQLHRTLFLTPYERFSEKSHYTTLLDKNAGKWKHLLDNGYHNGVLFMNLSKAFEVLDQSLLPAKLDVFGFFQKSMTFTKNYLDKRMRKVDVNNKFSAWENICVGFKRGSILVQSS